MPKGAPPVTRQDKEDAKTLGRFLLNQLPLDAALTPNEQRGLTGERARGISFLTAARLATKYNISLDEIVILWRKHA